MVIWNRILQPDSGASSGNGGISHTRTSEIGGILCSRFEGILQPDSGVNSGIGGISSPGSGVKSRSSQGVFPWPFSPYTLYKGESAQHPGDRNLPCASATRVGTRDWRARGHTLTSLCGYSDCLLRASVLICRAGQCHSSPQ